MMTLGEFEMMLKGSLETVVPRIEVGLEKVGQLAESMAAEIPGHQQPGWAPLAQATLDDKAAKGFEVPSPLKRTGDMAASYKKELVPTELAVVVGSPSKIALWQEVGTAHIPPRPVCEIAIKHSLPYAHDVFGEIAVSLLMGKK